MQYSTDVIAHVTKGTSDNQNFNVLKYRKPVTNLQAEEAPLLQQLSAIPSHPFDQVAADTMVGHLNTFREHFIITSEQQLVEGETFKSNTSSDSYKC